LAVADRGHGHSTQRHGYLSERTWAFAIALFLMLKGKSVAEAKQTLKPNVAELMGKAGRYLERNPELLSPLRAIA
jgi:hypothetical protein